MDTLNEDKDKSASVWECTSCGKTNKISDGFCTNCGAKNESKWVCRNCGQVNDCDDSFCIGCGKKQEIHSDEIDKPHPVSKTTILVVVFIAFIVITGIIVGYSLYNESNTTKTIDMGAIGNKITVDGTVAYVAGENKILVPYDFCGTFSECDREAYSKSLKGCVNQHLPSVETDDLPEEVAREIISFYGDTGGFWTSKNAAHSNIEIAGYESESLHYAGMMDVYFSTDSDGVSHSVWGYCLEPADDTTTMGLLVLYGVIVDEFEFTDVEDTADPNYSTEPVELYEAVMAPNDEDVVMDEYEFTGEGDAVDSDYSAESIYDSSYDSTESFDEDVTDEYEFTDEEDYSTDSIFDSEYDYDYIKSYDEYE